MSHPNVIKSGIWSTILCLCIALFATSCNEEDEITPITITIDDAAELVAYSLANRTYGAINDLNYVAEEVLELVGCNETESNDRTVSDSSTEGEITVSYTISELYSKNCEVGEIINYSFETDQVLTSVRYDIEQAISGAWTIEGVQENSTTFIYTGPYSRSGLWTYNLRDNHTDDVSYTSSFTNLVYDINSERITGGTSMFTLVGESTVYENYSYAGDIAFEGEDISIITFSTGEQYELNLETGEITEI